MKAKTALTREQPIRVLAVLLLVLVIIWALFSKGFRFGRDCEKTIGRWAPVGLSHSLAAHREPGAEMGLRI